MEWAHPYFLFVQRLAEYRRGGFDRAIAVMRGEVAKILGPAPRLVLAMALHKNGKTDEARRVLADAVGSHDWSEDRVRDQAGWICRAFRREA